MITVDHLNAAYELGQRLARDESEGGSNEPNDNPVDGFNEALDDYESRKTLIFRVTGEKIEPDSEDGWIITDNFENGYYDEWEEIQYEPAQRAA